MRVCVCGGYSLKKQQKKNSFSRRASEQESAQASSQQGVGCFCPSARPAQAGGYIPAVRHGCATVPGMKGKKRSANVVSGHESIITRAGACNRLSSLKEIFIKHSCGSGMETDCFIPTTTTTTNPAPGTVMCYRARGRRPLTG